MPISDYHHPSKLPRSTAHNNTSHPCLTDRCAGAWYRASIVAPGTAFSSNNSLNGYIYEPFI